MGKKIQITIEKGLQRQVIETNGIIGAFIGDEVATGSDTSQFLLGEMDQKERIKLLAGCINMIYRTADHEGEADLIVNLAAQVAKMNQDK